MSREKKVSVRLSKLDWQAIDRCLRSHAEGSTIDGKVLWSVGRDRVQFIRAEIARKLEESQSV